MRKSLRILALVMTILSVVCLFSCNEPEYEYKVDEQYTPKWNLVDEKSETVADGVEYTIYKYEDKDKKPYVVHVLEVDPKKNAFYMGTSKDGHEFIPTEEQDVVQHMEEAANNGKDVVAGINADFFYIDTDYHPRGLAIKEGLVISRGEDGRPYMAFKDNGEVEIGKDGTKADVNKFRTALGASHILVYEGIPQSFNMKNSSLARTNHPRTIAGVKKDGTVIMAVIDGRQEDVSNGASLEKCAQVMMDLGAEYAVNFDGGGSTTLVIERDGKCETANTLSGSSLRKVYNSLVVIKE